MTDAQTSGGQTPGGQPSTDQPSSLLTVAGTVTIRERVAIAGAVATVKVVDASGEVLAATAVEVEGVPATWTVTIDPEMVQDPDRLMVWAALRADVGVWGTLELAPLTFGGDVVLTRVPD